MVFEVLRKYYIKNSTAIRVASVLNSFSFEILYQNKSIYGYYITRL